MWLWKLCFYICFSFLWVQMQSSIQTTRLQERSGFIEFYRIISGQSYLLFPVILRFKSSFALDIRQGFSCVCSQLLPAGPVPVRMEPLAWRVANAPPSSVPVLTDTAESSVKLVHTAFLLSYIENYSTHRHHKLSSFKKTCYLANGKKKKKFLGPNDCYEDNGESYRGMVGVTAEGEECLYWNSYFILQKGGDPFKEYAGFDGIGSHSYCRSGVLLCENCYDIFLWWIWPCLLLYVKTVHYDLLEQNLFSWNFYVKLYSFFRFMSC